MPVLSVVKLTLPAARLRGSATIFSNQVEHLEEVVLDASRSALVRIDGLPGRIGVYNKTQLMAVRLLPASVDADALVTTLRAHLEGLRSKKSRLCAGLLGEGGGGEVSPPSFRWVHGDADGLPGLVVDDYGSVVVIQSSAHSGDFLLPAFIDAIAPLCAGRPLFERSSGQTRSMAGLPDRTRALQGDVPLEVEALLAGLRLRFSPARAQKTGLFLDQAYNLKIFAQLVRSGPRPYESMLDVCCYAGAWSAASAKSGVTRLTLVDQDAEALIKAKQNVELNAQAGQPVAVDTLHGDMFERLSVLGREGKMFDIVVADPPAFAKSKKHVPEARRAYARMTKLASKLVRPGGLLVVCSCSRNMDETEFLELVGGQLSQGESGPQGWSLVLRGGQSPDHTVPAGESLASYLKCAFYRREGA